MKFHPYSEGPHLLSGADFDGLVADIKENGLREKIVVFDGKILDGRNRFMACQKAKVRPQYRKFNGTKVEALKFVASLNKHRRHENESQRAMYASWLKEQFASLNLDSGDRTALAAEQMNVSRASVFHADKVRQEGSKALQRAVQSGEVSVSKAAKVTDLPKSEQLKAATTKPEKSQEVPEQDLMPEPEPLSADELAEMDEAAERARAELAEKIMGADDRFAAAETEVERLTRDLANMTRHRDHWMNQAGANAKFAKGLQRKIAKLTKQLENSQAEVASLRERVSVMEEAA